MDLVLCLALLSIRNFLYWNQNKVGTLKGGVLTHQFVPFYASVMTFSIEYKLAQLNQTQLSSFFRLVTIHHKSIFRSLIRFGAQNNSINLLDTVAEDLPVPS